jgi:3-hydroxybutyryl-CoA dehydratase
MADCANHGEDEAEFMNEYRYEDLKVGMSETFKYTVTAEKMKLFCEISGDTNPLHTELLYAKEHGFKQKVAYGMLSASLISALGGVYLPGKYCLIQQVEIKFLNPVYEGDELTVCGTVKELKDCVKRAVIKVEMKNQEGKKVVKGTLDVGFLE